MEIHNTLERSRVDICIMDLFSQGFFFSYSDNPVPCPSSSNFTIKNGLRNKQRAKQCTLWRASVCIKRLHACVVLGEAHIFVCICLTHPGRIRGKQVLLDASREEVQGENLFPLTGPQEKS